jgi:hypothetical protein
MFIRPAQCAGFFCLRGRGVIAKPLQGLRIKSKNRQISPRAAILFPRYLEEDSAEFVFLEKIIISA